MSGKSEKENGLQAMAEFMGQPIDSLARDLGLVEIFLNEKFISATTLKEFEDLYDLASKGDYFCKPIMARSVRKIFELIETTEVSWKWFCRLWRDLSDEGGVLWGFHDNGLESLDELRWELLTKANDLVKTPEEAIFLYHDVSKWHGGSLASELEDKLESFLREELKAADTIEKLKRVYDLVDSNKWMNHKQEQFHEIRQLALVGIANYFSSI